jgi:Na+-transporting NADH:ubiquinone oxidoreductase subunit F
MTEILLGIAIFTVVILALASIVFGARTVLLPDTPIDLVVNDSRHIPARAGLKLLAILNSAGIPLPSPCGGVGRCGQCRVTVTAGGGDPLPTETNLIRRSDLRAGTRLACQVVARTDLAVDVPEELFGVESWDCTVRTNRSLTPFIRELVLDLPAGKEISFNAGAYVQLTAPPYRLSLDQVAVPAEHRSVWSRYSLGDVVIRSDKPVTRAYSLASAPADGRQLVFNIRLALPPPGAPRSALPGIVSSFLFASRPGDIIAAVGPYGTFRARQTDREMVFIGGGVGMAPLRSIIRDQLLRLRTRRKMTFWYGARSPIELFYVDEFDRLSAAHDNFGWTVALSDRVTDGAWSGATGFIHKVAYERYLKDHPAPEDCEYYLCGPPVMIGAVFAMLEDLGVERDSIFFDDFGS